AKEEILISTYSMKGDELGLILLSVLRNQAMRGVKIKILADAVGSKIDRYLATHLASLGIEIKLFNSKGLNPIKMAKYRMHDKLFIVDREFLVMGGRNSKNVYYGMGDLNFRDRDIYFQGDI